MVEEACVKSIYEQSKNIGQPYRKLRVDIRGFPDAFSRRHVLAHLNQQLRPDTEIIYLQTNSQYINHQFTTCHIRTLRGCSELLMSTSQLLRSNRTLFLPFESTKRAGITLCMLDLHITDVQREMQGLSRYRCVTYDGAPVVLFPETMPLKQTS